MGFRQLGLLSLFLIASMACTSEKNEHVVLAVPSNSNVALGSEGEVDLYLVRKIAPEEIDLSTEQDSVSISPNDMGGLRLRQRASKQGILRTSGELKQMKVDERYRFSVEQFVLPLPPSVSVSTMVRGRKNRIEVALPGIPSSEITAVVTDGMIEVDQGVHYVTPGQKDTLKVMLLFTNSSGLKVWSAPVVFDVVD